MKLNISFATSIFIIWLIISILMFSIHFILICPFFWICCSINFFLRFSFHFQLERRIWTMAHLTIIHFNDIYNVEPNSSREPIGGAARFLTAIKTFAHLNPLVLFSGDAFSPSIRKFNSEKFSAPNAWIYIFMYRVYI